MHEEKDVSLLPSVIFIIGFVIPRKGNSDTTHTHTHTHTSLLCLRLSESLAASLDLAMAHAGSPSFQLAIRPNCFIAVAVA